jgi:hypothetical protein
MIKCLIAEPMFGDERKYIILELDSQSVQTIKFMHVKRSLNVKQLVDPLDGNLLRVKIPFRYNRVMCRYTGKTIQELVKGDPVEVDIKYCGWWVSGDFGGPSWKMESCSSSA